MKSKLYIIYTFALFLLVRIIPVIPVQVHSRVPDMFNFWLICDLCNEGVDLWVVWVSELSPQGKRPFERLRDSKK